MYSVYERVGQNWVVVKAGFASFDEAHTWVMDQIHNENRLTREPGERPWPKKDWKIEVQGEQ